MKSVQEIWHAENINPQALLKTAAHICQFSSANQCKIIADFLHKRGINQHHAPISISGNKTMYAVYHSGGVYSLYVLGEPETVLNMSSLSENKREKAMLESRRLTNGGAFVYSAAHGTVHTIPQSLKGIKGLEFDGHITIV